MSEEIVDNIIEEIKRKFKEIKAMGWIKSVQKGPSGLGITFERLIKEKEHDFELPDYHMFEIKTHCPNSNEPITLFNATPDSYVLEIKRIYDNYGYPDKDLPNAKNFIGHCSTIKKYKIGDHYFQLNVDRDTKQVILNVYDLNKELIDNKTRWSFAMIEEKLYRKIKYLAYVEATKNYADSIYYCYHKMLICQLRDFESFIKALEKGKIIVNFTISVFKSGTRKGHIHDHGTAFRLYSDKLYMLFEVLEVVE